MMILDVNDLHVQYSGATAVESLSFSAAAGEVVTILGANGAGKTSTLKGVMGMIPGTSGSVDFAGSSISTWRTSRIARAGLALVPQGRRVFASLTVEENLKLGGYRLRTRAASSGLLEQCYSMFPVLEERHKQRAGYLSGGEQQMLAFGRAIMARPEVVLMDEPSMGLAPIVVRRVMEAARSIADTGIAVVMVEQNAVAALSVADRVLVLDLGRTVWSGVASAALDDPALKRAFLGEVSLDPAKEGSPGSDPA